MRRAGDVLAAMRALPIVAAADLATPLVLAPHPDDETLGCGGLIATLCDLGRPPAVLLVTDGARSHPGSASYPPERLRSLRAREALAASAILGLSSERVRFLDLPDGAAPMAGDDFAAAVSTIRRTAARFGCTALAASWRHDPHCDHQATAAMARASGLRVLSYPVWGWLLPHEAPIDEPVSGCRIPVDHVLDRKRRAMAAHRTQMGLITDDPDGFVVPDALLDACITPFEVFLENCP